MTRLPNALCLPALILAVAAAAGAQTLTATTDYTDTVDGTPLYWQKADYTDPTVAAGAALPFGLTVPSGYTAGGGTAYPLVLYLHGAGARGDDDNDQLRRDTATYFATTAQTTPAYNAFVLAPQTSGKWANFSWGLGTYVQSADTYAESMHLLENLLAYVTDATNNANLGAALGINAGDIDLNRLYVVGDSMGACGTFDLLARQPNLFAGAVESTGAGPSNKTAEVAQTPLWTIHGTNDGTIPNALPADAPPSGKGALGMLGLIDPTFDNSGSTAIVTKDDPQTAADDPGAGASLIYSEFVGYGHNPPAAHWTEISSGSPSHRFVDSITPWLFAQTNPSPAFQAAGSPGPATTQAMGADCTVDGAGLLTSVVVGPYVVPVAGLCTGSSTGVRQESYKDPEYDPSHADNFEVLHNCTSRLDPIVTTMFGGQHWHDTNGDNPDFFVFENGGSLDEGTLAAVFPDGTVGVPVPYVSGDWFVTAHTTVDLPSQPLAGMCFAITDLKDAAGNYLENDAVILGIQMTSGGLGDVDPTCICAVQVPEPGTVGLLAVGGLCAAVRGRRRRRS